MNVVERVKQFFVRRLTNKDIAEWYNQERATDYGEIVTDYTAMSLSAVWACVNLISGTISTLPLMVYRTSTAGVRTVANDHPLYRLLHDSPNFDQTAVDFLDFISASIELWGNAYARKIIEGGRLVGLVPILPALPSVRRRSDGVIEYRWSEDGRSYVETEQTVLHIRGPGGSPLGGMSTLTFGRNSFAIARAAEKAAGKMFVNGLRPSAALVFKDWLSPQNRKTANEELAAKAGAENTGKPLILEGSAELKTFSINPEDAQMLESRQFSVEEICRFFGVPPHMVGHTQQSTSWGTGLEQQTLGFQKFTLRRRLKRMEQAFEKQLLTAADRASGFTIEFALEGLLRGDSAARATFYQQMSQIGALTINEIRALENLPPVKGGDIPRMQSQNVPITQTEKPKELTDETEE